MEASTLGTDDKWHLLEKTVDAWFPFAEDVFIGDDCAFPTEDIGDMESNTDGAAAISSNTNGTNVVGDTGDSVEGEFVTEGLESDKTGGLGAFKVTIGGVKDKAKETTIIDPSDDLMESDGANVEEESELEEPKWHQVWEIGPNNEDNWSNSSEEEIEFDNDNEQQNNKLREEMSEQTMVSMDKVLYL